MSGINPINIDQIISQLESAPEKIAQAHRNIAARAIRRSIEEVQANLYPGHGYDTGQLHDSYAYGGDILEADDKGVTWEFGTDVEYAPYVEVLWGGRCSHFRPMLMSLDNEMPLIIQEEYEDLLKQ